MKIVNILKKETKKVIKSNTQTLDKKQLEKVIGGGDGTVLSTDLKASDGKKHFEVTA